MPTTLPHEEALAALVERVATAGIPGLQRLVLFGSVARSTHERDSDVDVLAVIDDEADETAVEERLRDFAYDAMLEHGVAISVHGVSESTPEQRSDHPFFRRALADGKVVYD